MEWDSISHSSLQTLAERIDNVINTPFHRISYTDAVELLLKPEHVSGHTW